MRVVPAWTFGLGLLLWAGSASAVDLHAQLLEVLGGYEDSPSAATLQALGAGVEQELIAVVNDPSVPQSRRARAVFALGYFPSDATKAVLVSTLSSPDSILARKATYALANGWKEGALETLKPMLASPDVQLRMATAQALGSVQSESCRQAVRDRLAVETDEAVRVTLNQVLGG